MTKRQPRTRNFSIYMLCKKVRSPCECAIQEQVRDQAGELEDEVDKPDGTTDNEVKVKKWQFMSRRAHNLPGKTQTYLAAPIEEPLPWWVAYLGINKKLICPGTRAALTFLQVNGRWFALAFGHARHWLKHDCIEKNFGLRVALNSIDPEKLRSCDVLRPGTAFQIKTQAPANSDVNLFSFDWENELWRALSGLVKEEYADMFKWLSGNRSSVRCSSPVLVENIEGLLRILKNCYDGNAYEGGFPMSDFHPVECPEIERALYGQLEEALEPGGAGGVMLAVPEIIDDGSYDYACLDGVSSISRSDVAIDLYYEYADKYGKAFKAYDKGDIKELCLVAEDGETFKRYPIDRCFVFETTLGKNKYCLNEGEWYEIDNELWEKVEKYLCEHCRGKIVDLPEFRGEEEDYNRSVGRQFGYLCLDRTNIGHTLEPCDLFTTTPASEDDLTPIPTLVHVKKYRSSQDYSHLFNQGLNSALAILEDPETLNEMNNRIEERFIMKLAAEKRFKSRMKWKLKRRKAFAKPWQRRRNLKLKRKFKGRESVSKRFEKINPATKLRVVFAAAVPRSNKGRLKDLPYLSQISLYRAIKSSNRNRIDVHLQFIYMKEGK